ncbi:MAG: AMP-binding protein [Hyphomicrobiales bacterium]|nr:AMP-binding protein [Hyphomicrobiales bacterium]
MNAPANVDLADIPYRRVGFPERRTIVEHRPDGALILRSARMPRKIEHNSFAGFVPAWALRRGYKPAFSERDAQGNWRTLTWTQLWEQMQIVASSLLDLGLGPDRPLIFLSGNSIEQAVALLAAEYVGIPAAPVSPPYSLLSKDFTRLKGVTRLLKPSAIFVQNSGPFERAIAAMDMPDAKVIAVADARDSQIPWARLAGGRLTAAKRSQVEAAHNAIRAEQTVRILFTSGSTGEPKGVPASYANFQALAGIMLGMWESLSEPQPIFLDWLPWHHGFGGYINFGRTLLLGGAHYIDDGRPLPGMFDRTVRNLREVAPTIFGTVPVAWAMLVSELERDPALARNMFSNAVHFGYGGASLQRDVWERVQRVAVQTVGERIMFSSALGSTETTGGGTWCDWPQDELGNIGVPSPGSELKLLPLESDENRYEIRVRSPANFNGYVGRPDLTAAAFDDERFFRLGDAVRLVDPADPGKGLRFDGRVVEDFKLANGTWVRTGIVRLALLDRCAPLITDAVVCGQDGDFVGALAWPNIAACQRLAPELSNLDAPALVRHPIVIQALRQRLEHAAGGASQIVQRVMLMAEPPSIDANEIADKGYINQAATRARRAHLVAELLQNPPAPHIAVAE